MLRGFWIWTIAIIVILSALPIGVIYDIAEPESLPTVPYIPPIRPPNVHLKIETNQDSYGLDENVNITLKILNEDDDSATFNFSTDHQYDLFIYNSRNNEVFNLFENFTAYNNQTNITLSPDSEKALLEKYTWNRADKNGRQVSQGNYRIYAKLIGYNISDEKEISIGEHREVYIKVITDKNVYRMGENVSISAYLVNEMNKTLVLWFQNSCLLDCTKIYNSSGAIIFDTHLDGICAHAIGNLAIEVGSEEWLPPIFAWDQLNYTYPEPPCWFKEFYPEFYCSLGFKQVPSDVYGIKFTLSDPLQSEPYSSWNTPMDYKPEGMKHILII